MSSRLRQSTTAATPRPGRHSTTAIPTPSRTGNNAPQIRDQLPPYEPLAHALTATGQAALQHLLQSRKLSTLDGFNARIKEAIDCLSDNAAAINDAVREKDVAVTKTRRRHDRDSADDEEEELRVQKLEEDLRDMKGRVDGMTQKMDMDLRKILDSREYFNAVRPVLEEIAHETSRFAREFPAQTQPVTTRPRSQRRRRENASGSDEDSDSADEEYPDFDPTDPTNVQQTPSTQPPPAPMALFKTKLSRKKDRYQNLGPRLRYGSDNDYRAFRGAVHDARFAGTDIPLGHESTWFTNDGVAALPQPGVTPANNGGGDDGVSGDAGAGAGAAEDSDDDLQIAKETISTKCPLTLQEFKHPLTSRKCPHSFEQDAILGMIDNPSNTVRVGGSNQRGARDGVRAVQCPVTGCSSMLTKADLRADPVLLRKIRRIQRANAEDEDEDEEDETLGDADMGGRDRPQEIGSGDESDAGVDVEDVPDIRAGGAGERASKRFKMERFSGRPAR